MRKPDRFAVSFEGAGGRRPGPSASIFPLPNPFQIAMTYEPAHRASAVKLQVTAEGSEGEARWLEDGSEYGCGRIQRVLVRLF
jgi:hypothetical protein